jgi:hypothetical protein
MAFPLFSLFSNDSAEEAARLANEGRQQGYAQLSDLYGQGRTAISTGYGKAADTLKGVGDFYKPGAMAYGDVSGAHGVAGLQRGTDLFRNSGQYGVYGVANDAAQQAIQRARAASGNAASGNADYGAAKAASDLAGGYFGQFQQGLAPYLANYGTAQGKLADTYSGEGTALNASFMGQGNAANANETAQGANLAGAEMNNYNVGANWLNAIKGAAGFVAGGGPANFASGAKGLFSAFA